MARLLIIGLTALAMLLASAASAHKPSDSYLSLVVDEQRVMGRWDIALRDLEHAIGLDRDGNGAVTWGEVKARHGDIAAYALARLELSSAGSVCATSPVEHLIDQHSDGAYAVLRFTGDCPAAIDALDIRYSFLFDLDPLHRGPRPGPIGRSDPDERLQPRAAYLARPHRQLEPGAAARDLSARGRLAHLDRARPHPVPAVPPAAGRTAARQGAQEPSQRSAPVWIEVVQVVTSFTVAHSITLSLAALGILSFPARLVELAIAASVVFAALNNIRPMVTRRLWLIAFGFGLVHGLGFASVLADLALPRHALLLALLGLQPRGGGRPAGAGRVVLRPCVGVASPRRDLAAVGNAAAGVRHRDHRRGLVHRTGVWRRVGRLGTDAGWATPNSAVLRSTAPGDPPGERRPSRPTWAGHGAPSRHVRYRPASSSTTRAPLSSSVLASILHRRASPAHYAMKRERRAALPGRCLCAALRLWSVVRAALRRALLLHRCRCAIPVPSAAAWSSGERWARTTRSRSTRAPWMIRPPSIRR